MKRWSNSSGLSSTPWFLRTAMVVVAGISARRAFSNCTCPAVRIEFATRFIMVAFRPATAGSLRDGYAH